MQLQIQSLLSAICPAGITLSAIWIIGTVYHPLHLLVFCGWIGADNSGTNIFVHIPASFSLPFCFTSFSLFKGFQNSCAGRGRNAVFLDRHAFIYSVRFTVNFIPLKLHTKKCSLHFCSSCSVCTFLVRSLVTGRCTSNGRLLPSLPHEYGMGEIQDLLLLLLLAVEGQCPWAAPRWRRWPDFCLLRSPRKEVTHFAIKIVAAGFTLNKVTEQLLWGQKTSMIPSMRGPLTVFQRDLFNLKVFS